MRWSVWGRKVAAKDVKLWVLVRESKFLSAGITGEVDWMQGNSNATHVGPTSNDCRQWIKSLNRRIATVCEDGSGSDADFSAEPMTLIY